MASAIISGRQAARNRRQNPATASAPALPPPRSQPSTGRNPGQLPADNPTPSTGRTARCQRRQPEHDSRNDQQILQRKHVSSPVSFSPRCHTGHPLSSEKQADQPPEQQLLQQQPARDAQQHRPHHTQRFRKQFHGVPPSPLVLTGSTAQPPPLPHQLTAVVRNSALSGVCHHRRCRICRTSAPQVLHQKSRRSRCSARRQSPPDRHPAPPQTALPDRAAACECSHAKQPARSTAVRLFRGSHNPSRSAPSTAFRPDSLAPEESPRPRGNRWGSPRAPQS